jgi:hypothetical protein
MVRMGNPEIKKRRRKRMVDEHQCVHCGEWFIAHRSDARYCPPPKLCRLKASRERRKAADAK